MEINYYFFYHSEESIFVSRLPKFDFMSRVLQGSQKGNSLWKENEKSLKIEWRKNNKKIDSFKKKYWSSSLNITSIIMSKLKGPVLEDNERFALMKVSYSEYWRSRHSLDRVPLTQTHSLEWQSEIIHKNEITQCKFWKPEHIDL